MIQFFRKNGWQLNPDDKKLNNIIKAILRNKDNCPCQRNGSFKCPCEEYKNNDNCHCGLYIKTQPEVQGNEGM